MQSTEARMREFVRTHSRELLRAAWLLTGDWALAEDLVQTALLQCWPRWSSLDAPDAYVRRTLLNVYLSWQRRRWTGEVPAEVVPEVAVVDEHGPAELRASIQAALSVLSPRERAVIVCRYYADLSLAETATALGVSVGAVKRYASDALSKLRTAPSLAGLIDMEVGS